MMDFFRDKLGSLDQSSSSTGKIIGGWDIHNKQYVLSLQPFLGTYSTLSFDDSVNGFPSLFSYTPDHLASVKNKFFSTKNGKLYVHNEAIGRVATPDSMAALTTAIGTSSIRRGSKGLGMR